MSETLRQMMGLPPLVKPEAPKRRPGTDWVSMRDARLRRRRMAKARAAAADTSGIAVTVCPAATAEGAYDASINGRAAARAKAYAKRR